MAGESSLVTQKSQRRRALGLRKSAIGGKVERTTPSLELGIGVTVGLIRASQ